MSDESAEWGIIGHAQATGLLARSVAVERISHAYLIEGAEQTGKTTLALAFARALSCTGTRRPCGECRTCRLMSKGTHPDLRVIRLQGNGERSSSSARRKEGAQGDGSEGGRRVRTKNIPVEDVRAMLRDASLAPYEARWKVYIIRYAEELSIEATQALLKTLEEPPAHVVLILTTADAKILPLTVISRCQRVLVGPVTASEIERALRERYGASTEQARLLAHLSGGRPGWALGALTDPTVTETRAQRLEALSELVRMGRYERIGYAEQLAAEFTREPTSATGILDMWLNWWRDLLLVKSGAGNWVTNVDREQELQVQAASLGAGQMVRAIQAIRSALLQLHQSANPRLALEVMMLGVPTAAS